MPQIYAAAALSLFRTVPSFPQCPPELNPAFSQTTNPVMVDRVGRWMAIHATQWACRVHHVSTLTRNTLYSRRILALILIN